MSSTSVKLAVTWIRSASLGRSQKAATQRSALSLSNLCRHQKSRWVRCRVVDMSTSLRRDLPHGSVSRIDLSSSHEWLEDRSRARCDGMSQWAVLVTGSPNTGKTDGVRLLARHVGRTFLVCDIREVKGRKLVVLILKGQGGLRQTSVAILNIDTDVTDMLKWRSRKAAHHLQIPLIFVCDDGVACVWRFDTIHKTLSRRCDN